MILEFEWCCEETKVVVWVEPRLDPASSVEQFRGGTLASRKPPHTDY